MVMDGRCLYSLHLNEWLRRQGLLVARKKSTGLLHRHYIQDWTQYHAKELLAQRHVPDALSPSKRPMSHYTARLIAQEETVAHVVELAGLSPFGGIALNRACIERAGNGLRRCAINDIAPIAAVTPQGQTGSVLGRGARAFVSGEV